MNLHNLTKKVILTEKNHAFWRIIQLNQQKTNKIVLRILTKGNTSHVWG